MLWQILLHIAEHHLSITWHTSCSSCHVSLALMRIVTSRAAEPSDILAGKWTSGTCAGMGVRACAFHELNERALGMYLSMLEGITILSPA